MVQSQVERLKRDLKNLEDYEKQLDNSEKLDNHEMFIHKKQYLKNYIETIENTA